MHNAHELIILVAFCKQAVRIYEDTMENRLIYLIEQSVKSLTRFQYIILIKQSRIAVN